MGFGDFVKGVAGAVGDVASDIGGDIGEDIVGAGVNVAKAGAWAATHVDDAVKGVAEYGGEMAKGVGWLASHPGYWDDAAKQMVVDQFTDPVNIATNIGMLGLTIATGGAAAPAWMAKLGLGVKVGAETATGLATAAKVADTAVDVGKAARTASRMERFATGAQKVANKIDEIQGLPTELIQKGRSAVTGKLSDVTGGLVKRRELSYLQQGRKSLATCAFGEVEDLKSATGLGGQASRLGYRTVAGGAGKSELIGAGSFGELNWRANRLSGQATGVRDFRENVQVTKDLVQAAAHPEQAGKELAQAAWHEYGDEATSYAMQNKGAIKKVLGMDEEKKRGGKDTAEKTYDPYQQPVAEPLPGMTDFRLDNTRSTKTSKRTAGQPTVLGTVTKESTMPSQIGPSDWYGPQNGYKAGRGFSSRTASALPPLEQPRLGAV